MPVLNAIAGYAELMTGWRQHLHRHPELGFECHETAAFIADRLREFGVDEVHEAIATSGIVAIINGQGEGPVMGLRADMDALPITEVTGVEYASTRVGKMHACGHDGHVTMMLGAAKYLCETRRFKGKVAMIFQPAEEAGAGAQVMVQDGIMERFGIGQIYALHNMPGLALGHFHTTRGDITASADTLAVRVTGKGGHGAMPHDCIDPVVAIVSMVQALQTILSRNVFALHQAVISVTEIHVGTASNIVPDQGWFGATIRCFDPELRQMMKRRIYEIVEGQAAAFGVTVAIDYEWGYPATVNHTEQAMFAAQVAAQISGPQAVQLDAKVEMWSEDFSYMLQARPGAYLLLGIGSGAGLHHPAYNFNDDAAPIGASFFAKLVETAQPLA
ncbi:MAG: hippurate hydrolase [Pseudorhodobacter sp.]|jgi:hippurate hydrolase